MKSKTRKPVKAPSAKVPPAKAPPAKAPPAKAPPAKAPPAKPRRGPKKKRNPYNGPHRKESPTAFQLKKAELRKEAWDMRIEGWSYRDIADKLDVSIGGVYKLLKKELSRFAAELDDRILEYIFTDMIRIDEIIKAHYGLHVDHRSAKIILDAIGTRVKLLQIQKKEEREELLSDEQRDQAINSILDQARTRQTRQAVKTTEK